MGILNDVSSNFALYNKEFFVLAMLPVKILILLKNLLYCNCLHKNSSKFQYPLFKENNCGVIFDNLNVSS